MRLDLEWLMPKFHANRLDVYRGHRGYLPRLPMMRAGWRSVGSLERGAVFRGALEDLR